MFARLALVNNVQFYLLRSVPEDLAYPNRSRPYHPRYLLVRSSVNCGLSYRSEKQEMPATKPRAHCNEQASVVRVSSAALLTGSVSTHLSSCPLFGSGLDRFGCGALA